MRDAAVVIKLLYIAPHTLHQFLSDRPFVRQRIALWDTCEFVAMCLLFRAAAVRRAYSELSQTAVI